MSAEEGRPYVVKLVRDKVGDLLAGDNRVTYEPAEEHLSHDEIIQLLRAKLIEEATEYLLNPSVGELADVLTVVEALAYEDLGCGLNRVQVEAMRKLEERGGFDSGTVMICRTLAPKWEEQGRRRGRS